MPLSFSYETFSASQREIRLLELLPGKGAIECTIRHVNLDEAAPFEALSYCWGDGIKNKRISLNGANILITKNLHDALHRLRQGINEPRTLWIDAICINQSDVPEKNVQVSRMKDIYTSSREVLVWLGDENSQTRKCFEALHYLASVWDENPHPLAFDYPYWQSERHTQRSSSLVRSVPYSQYLTVISDQWAYTKVLDSICTLFEYPYFSRVWIVQEVVSCSQVTVLCGSFQTPWKNIWKAYNVVSEWKSSNHARVGTLLTLRDMWLRKEPAALFDCVKVARIGKATDPRDKVYALRGLLKDSGFEGPLGVDYTKDPEEIFIEFTGSYLSKGYGLDILAFCRGVSDDATRPSWILDYQSTGEVCSFILNSRMYPSAPNFSAGGETPQQVRLSENNRSLCLRGIVLDVITERSNMCEFRPPTPQSSMLQRLRNASVLLQQFRNFYLDAKRVCLRNNRQTYSFCDEPIFHALWRTFNSLHTPWLEELDGQAAEEASGEEGPVGAYHKFYAGELFNRVDRLITQGDFGEESSSRLRSWTSSTRFLFASFYDNVAGPWILEELWVYQTHYAITGRRLIQTEKGYIGLAGKSVEVGDHVVLVEGLETPLVLRRKGEQWKIVGDCYVHGVMNGEAFDVDACEDLWIN